MSIVKTTKNINEAQLITHGGVFHADDVMATVILAKLFGEVTVCRTFKVPDNLSQNPIVYDIGFGKFDHHQTGGNGVRKNGVPYAACGLIWKEFGNILLKDTCNPLYIWRNLDNNLIQGIDAVDNGAMPSVNYPAHALSFSQAIFAFNPSWDSEETNDEAFVRAVAFAEIVFDNALKQAESKAKAKRIIEKAIEKEKDHIMVLDQFAPWKEHIFTSRNEKAKDIQFVLYPSLRGGYNWECVPAEPGSFAQRKPVPPEWKGLRDEDLQKVTGIATAIFCHPAGFIGSAETLDDAISMAKIAINA